MVGCSPIGPLKRLIPMSCGDGVGEGLDDGVGDGLVEGVGDGLVEGVGEGDGPIDGDGDALTMCLLSTASDPEHEAFAAAREASKSTPMARSCANRIDHSPSRRLSILNDCNRKQSIEYRAGVEYIMKQTIPETGTNFRGLGPRRRER